MTVTETMLLSLTHYLLLLFISSGPSIMCCGLTQKLTLQIWLQLRCLGMCGKLLCSMYINLCTRTVFHFPALRSRCVALHYVPVPLRSIAFPLRSFAFHSVAFLFATVALPLLAFRLCCAPVALRSRSVAFHSFAFRCFPVALRFGTFLCVPFSCVSLRSRCFAMCSRYVDVPLRCDPVVLRSRSVPVAFRCSPFCSFFASRSHCVAFPFRSIPFFCVPLRSRCVAFLFVAFPFRSVALRCASVRAYVRSIKIYCVPVAFRCDPLRSRCVPLNSILLLSLAFRFALVAFPLRCVPVMLRSRSVAFHSVAFFYAPVSFRSVLFHSVAFCCVAFPLCCASIAFRCACVCAFVRACLHACVRVCLLDFLCPALRCVALRFRCFAFPLRVRALVRSFVLSSRCDAFRACGRPCLSCVPVAFLMRSLCVSDAAPL